MKKIISLLLFISVFSLLIGCSANKKSLSELKHTKISEVTKIEIANGQNGKKTEITDQQTIRNFYKDIKGIELVQNNDNDVKGWLYSVTLYKKQKKVLSFTTSEIVGKTEQDDEKFITAIETLLNQK
ncbi:hypothetical protein V5E38_01490 [Rossellomorea sp. GAMAL-10_SWC]